MMSGDADKTFTIGLNIDDAKSVAMGKRQIEMMKSVEAAAASMNKTIQSLMDQNARESEAKAKRHADNQIRIAEAEAKREAEILKEREERKTKEADEAAKKREAIAQREADKAVRAAQRAHELQIKEAEKSSSKGMKFGADMLSMFGGFTSIAGGIGMAFGAVKSGLADLDAARQKMKELGDEALKTRASLRDIAALRGEATVSNEMVQKFGEFQKRTGMGLPQAKGFITEFESSVATATDANMSPEERSKLSNKAALLAARVNPDGDTANVAGVGKLAGTLARFEKGGTAAGVTAKLDALTRIAALGEGKQSEQFDQLSKVLTLLVTPEGDGLAKNSLEAGALVATMSSTRPVGEAATGVQQLGRAMRGFQNTQRLPGATMSQADYLKSLKINEKDSIFQAFDKMFPDLDRAVASGRAPDAYLKERGLSNEEEVNAVVAMYRAKKQGTMGQIRGAAGGPLDVAGTERKEKQFLGSKDFRAASADAGIEYGKVIAGQNVEEFNIAMKQAEAAMTPTGELNLPGNWLQRQLHGTDKVRSAMIRNRAIGDLAKSGKLGKEVQSNADSPWQMASLEDRDDTELNSMIEQAKLEKAAAAVQPMVNEQIKTNQLLGRMVGGPITAPQTGAGKPTKQP